MGHIFARMFRDRTDGEKSVQHPVDLIEPHVRTRIRDGIIDQGAVQADKIKHDLCSLNIFKDFLVKKARIVAV